jgi:hypothetical protein
MRVAKDPYIMVGGLVVCSLIVAAYGLHGSYKTYFWPQIDAVVDRIETTCQYVLKSSGRRGLAENIDCNAQQEAAALIANGYKFSQEVRRVFVAYEMKPGQQSHARVMVWPDDAGVARIGARVRVRYSPIWSGEVEAVSAADNRSVVIFAVSMMAAIGSCIFLMRGRRRQPLTRPEQASSAIVTHPE